MEEKQGLKAILGVVGLLSLLIFILACKATWSPDSSKVLFPYISLDTDEGHIALYDRNTGAVRAFYSCEGSPSGDCPPETHWEQDGSRAVIVLPEAILMLPVGSQEPAQMFRLDDKFDNVSLEVNGNLYLVGEKLARVNLRTGEAKYRENEEEKGVFLLSGGRGEIFYVTEINGTEIEGGEPAEIGTIDPVELTLSPLFEFTVQELSAYEVEDLTGPPDFHEPYFAFVAQRDARDFIALYTRAGFERVIDPKLPLEEYRLGTLDWSTDGKLLYATVIAPVEPEGWAQFSIAEISTDGETSRVTDIARVKGEWNDRDDLAFFWISLSPDGSTIATSLALIDPEDIVPVDRALILMDVKDLDRPVTRIPIPPPRYHDDEEEDDEREEE